MKRVLSTITVLLALGAAACGGAASDETATRGDDAPRATRTPKPEAPKATATSVLHPIRTPSPDEVPSASSGSGGGLASLLNTALGASSGGAAGLGGGDSELEQYLLDDSDLPSGYATFGEFSFRAPDGISTSGGADISASLAMKGDPADTTDIAMLMSMVMRFDDLQDLESMFGEAGELDPQAIEEAIDDAGAGGMIRDIEMLDASGLGDHAFGMTMTMDLGGIVEGFGGDGGDLGGLDAMTIHMYFFGRGKYAGALMRLGTGETLGGDVDEMALARILDAKLKSAP